MNIFLNKQQEMELAKDGETIKRVRGVGKVKIKTMPNVNESYAEKGINTKLLNINKLPTKEHEDEFMSIMSQFARPKVESIHTHPLVGMCDFIEVDFLDNIEDEFTMIPVKDNFYPDIRELKKFGKQFK